MAKTPLSIATRGRITTIAKKTLTLATIGWLLSGSTIPIKHPEDVIKYYDNYKTGPATSKSDKVILYTKHLETIKKRILEDDKEILEIIKIWLTLQI